MKGTGSFSLITSVLRGFSAGGRPRERRRKHNKKVLLESRSIACNKKEEWKPNKFSHFTFCNCRVFGTLAQRMGSVNKNEILFQWGDNIFWCKSMLVYSELELSWMDFQNICIKFFLFYACLLEKNISIINYKEILCAYVKNTCGHGLAEAWIRRADPQAGFFMTTNTAPPALW